MNRQEVPVKVPIRPDIEKFICPDRPGIVYINMSCTQPGITMILKIPKLPKKQKQQ